jgi:hypothetical protein
VPAPPLVVSCLCVRVLRKYFRISLHQNSAKRAVLLPPTTIPVRALRGEEKAAILPRRGWSLFSVRIRYPGLSVPVLSRTSGGRSAGRRAVSDGCV